jgi:hypothetical protein
MHPRMVDLVSKKWERFARRIFFGRFLGTLTYLFIFLLTTILDQTRTETVFIFCLILEMLLSFVNYELKGLLKYRK